MDTKPTPFTERAPLPASPIVVVDFPHVNATGSRQRLDGGRPRWHNPSEVDSVVDVLRLVRASGTGKKPTLAVLFPYAAQVELLAERISTAVKWTMGCEGLSSIAPYVRGLTRSLIAGTAVLLALLDPADAHPHVWVTMQSEIVYAEDGMVTEIRHRWTFDEMFSTLAVQGLDKRKKGGFLGRISPALPK